MSHLPLISNSSSSSPSFFSSTTPLPLPRFVPLPASDFPSYSDSLSTFLLLPTSKLCSLDITTLDLSTSSVNHPDPALQGHTLLTHAVIQRDTKRLTFLCTHPHIHTYINLVHAGHHMTPLAMASYVNPVHTNYRGSPTLSEERQQQEQALDIALMDILISHGAAPVVPSNQWSAFHCAIHYAPLYVATRLLSVFASPDIPMTHRIRITTHDAQHCSAYALVAANPFYGEVQQQRPMRCADMIRELSQQQQEQQTQRRMTFLAGTHPRVGAASAIFRVFLSSSMYDAQLMHHIMSFIPYELPLPVEQARAQQLAARRKPM